jgi:branched-chain amino acid transport system substrate-binding protein
MSSSTQLTRRQLTLVTAGTLVSSLAMPRFARAQSEKILLGQSAAFSGAAAQLGIQFKAGAEVYFEKINKQGGINRKTIELTSLDDGYEPGRCAENTQKLLDSGVSALFGYIGTPTSAAALPLASKLGVPFVAPFTGAMGLRTGNDSRVAYHLRASYDDETALIVKQLNNLELKKIAVFYQNDAYGNAGLSGVTKALATINSKPVAQATVERNSVDVASSIATLTKSGADAIVQISAYKSCAAFIREAKKVGYGGKFYNVSFVGTKALSDELGKDGAGVAVSQVVPSPYSSATPIAREFQADLKAHSKPVDANYSSFEGYLAAKLMVDALRRTNGRFAPAQVLEGLAAVGNQSYGGFNISLSASDHVASQYVELSMLTGDGRVRV